MRKNDYISKIKANIGIYSSKKSLNILDGSYVSVYTGTSMNFEDLREYVPGDAIRDIDWKASSRHGGLLVKRYVAEKKHNMMFVLDTGVKMMGDTPSGDSKKDIALYSFGALSYLAQKNGDEVAGAYYDNGKMHFEPFKTGLTNIEKILSFYESAILNNSSNLQIGNLLDSVMNLIRRRMIIFVITDLKGAASVSENTLKHLKCRHDLLFVIAEDALVTEKSKKSYDVESGRYIPAFITENKKLIKLEREKKKTITEDVENRFKKYGIASVYISNENKVIPSVIELLEKHKYVNKR